MGWRSRRELILSCDDLERRLYHVDNSFSSRFPKSKPGRFAASVYIDCIIAEYDIKQVEIKISDRSQQVLATWLSQLSHKIDDAIDYWDVDVKAVLHVDKNDYKKGFAFFKLRCYMALYKLEQTGDRRWLEHR